METNLILLADKDETWIEKYRAALAELDRNTPTPKGLEKLRAAIRGVCDKARYRINKVMERRVLVQRPEQPQILNREVDQLSASVSQVLIEGMKRVETQRLQSLKKARSTKSPRAGTPNKNIA